MSDQDSKVAKGREKGARGSKDAARALHELRAMGARLRDERKQIESLPVPLEQAQAAASSAIAAEVARIVGDMYLASLTKPQDRQSPSLSLTREQRADLAFAAQAEGVDALLNAALAEKYRAGQMVGIDVADRSAELDRIDADLLDIELSEEHLIRAMEADGAAPLRRPDADPRALLCADGEPE